jgi:hypothetical protein
MNELFPFARARHVRRQNHREGSPQMDQYENTMSDAWASQPMAAPIPAATPESRMAGARVLARLPDLDAPQQDPPLELKPSRSDGRMIGQRLSTRLLVGGAVVLVLAAIVLPMLMKDDPKPGNEGLPAWHPGMPAPTADEAPPWNAPTAQTPDTPAPEPIILQPQVPPALGAVPKDTEQGPALRPPDWNTQSQVTPLEGQRQAPVAAEPIPGRWNDRMEAPSVERQPAISAWSYPSPPSPPSPPGAFPNRGRASVAERPLTPDGQSPPLRYDGRFGASQPNPGYQAPYRQPQSSANRSMAIDNTTSAGAGAYRTGDRRDYRPDARVDYGPDPRGNYRENPQTDPRTDPRRGYVPHSLRSPQPAQPGAAKLQGIITPFPQEYK